MLMTAFISIAESIVCPPLSDDATGSYLTSSLEVGIFAFVPRLNVSVVLDALYLCLYRISVMLSIHDFLGLC